MGVFAKSVFESIEDSRELDEAEERGVEFVIASAESRMPFDATPKIFHAMASPIEPAGKRSSAATFIAPRNAGVTAEVTGTRTQSIGIETFVGEKRAAPSSQVSRFMILSGFCGVPAFVD
jgi:hypothetical protein